MLTKLRSLPSALYRCALRPECLLIRSASSSPTVLPSTSTASFRSVNGRSGVGIRILVAIELALFKCGTVFFQKPHGHRRGCARGHGDDDVRERGPRVIEIVLRRPRRVIRMRVIKPEQLAAKLGRALLRRAVIRRPDHESPPGT